MTNKRTKTDQTNIIATSQEQLIDITSNVDLLKGIAFMEYNNEEYFIIEGIVYASSLEDARNGFLEDIEGTEEADIDANFAIYCMNNLSEVEEADKDGEIGNYRILTDEEAQELCTTYIKESLWAFNAEFIIEHSKLPYDAIEMVRGYQQDKCESANDTIEALIEDIDTFIEDAISADGRGHFMNTYDGNEDEQRIDIDGESTTFYIYRMN